MHAKASDPADDAFDMERYPFYRIVRASQTYNRVVEQAMRAIGMDLPSWRVLMILHQHHPCRIGQIAEYAVIKLPTITRIIQRMQRDGFVMTVRQEADSRVVDVFMTEKGHAALVRVRALASSIFKRAMDGLQETDVDALLNGLTQIEANLKPTKVAAQAALAEAIGTASPRSGRRTHKASAQ
jgi:MarR family transcriptional regulator, organic hydroperoxide resistance regulator